MLLRFYNCQSAIKAHAQILPFRHSNFPFWSSLFCFFENSFHFSVETPYCTLIDHINIMATFSFKPLNYLKQLIECLYLVIAYQVLFIYTDCCFLICVLYAALRISHNFFLPCIRYLRIINILIFNTPLKVDFCSKRS